LDIPQADLDSVRNRLSRAQGQLGGVIKMVEEGRDCTDILNQLAAAQAAVSKAAFSLMASGMAHCGKDEAGLANRAKLEKAFLSLS
jgi:DNA-binding FrmR family transcriptional regulator